MNDNGNMETADAMDGVSLISKPEVAKLTGISERSIERLVSSGQFPKPRLIPPGRLVRWRRQDITDWIESLAVVR